MHLQKNLPYYILFTLLLPLYGLLNKVVAQNVTAPYSILGIGDVDTKDYGRYAGSGNASLARRDMFSYNFSNPASLSALPFKTTHFDIAMRSRFSTYSYPNTDTNVGIPSNDMVIKRFTMAFKVSEKTGFAIGLKPFSSVNYTYLNENAILDGNTEYLKFVDGSGGINQFYFSLGKEVAKNLSIGFTTSWLFGALQRSTQYISPQIGLNITKQEKDFYSGAHFQLGIQYNIANTKKWQHWVGLTANGYSNLNGQLTTEYNDGTGAASFIKEITNNRHFKMPYTIGLGYTATKNNRLKISADAVYNHWLYQKVNLNNSYTHPSFRFSTGIEYGILKNDGFNTYEKGYISAGFSAENGYIHIYKNPMIDASFSVGFGRNITRNISIYGGVEAGTRGNKTINQIRESYVQGIFGITLKEIWLGPKYTRRYD